MKSCDCRGCRACQDPDGLGCRRRAIFRFERREWRCHPCEAQQAAREAQNIPPVGRP
jgi:hypothetical protein